MGHRAPIAKDCAYRGFEDGGLQRANSWFRDFSPPQSPCRWQIINLLQKSCRGVHQELGDQY
eukprot:14641768-Alexandrium_andersonii.AAC.1